MSRTLYLGAEAREVVLDGPALLVRVEDGPGTRVPLRLLARVVARPAAEWSTAALVACLSGGVAVSFLKPDGAPLGHCLPAARRASDLAGMLDRLERERDASEAFSNWVRSEERRAILRLARKRPWAATHGETRPDKLREAALAAASPDRAAGAQILAALEGLLAAHLPGLLSQAGLPPRWASPAPPGRLDLCTACHAAARWMLVPALEAAATHRRRHPRAWRAIRERDARIARQFEGHAPAIARDLHERLRRLEFLLWEREP
jgi:hypothetical protein